MLELHNNYSSRQVLKQVICSRQCFKLFSITKNNGCCLICFLNGTVTIIKLLLSKENKTLNCSRETEKSIINYESTHSDINLKAINGSSIQISAHVKCLPTATSRKLSHIIFLTANYSYSHIFELHVRQENLAPES